MPLRSPTPLRLLLLGLMVNFAPTLTLSIAHPMPQPQPPSPPLPRHLIGQPSPPSPPWNSLPIPGPKNTSRTNVTLLGHNLCKFCTAVTYPCEVKETRICAPSEMTKHNNDDHTHDHDDHTHDHDDYTHDHDDHDDDDHFHDHDGHTHDNDDYTHDHDYDDHFRDHDDHTSAPPTPPPPPPQPPVPVAWCTRTVTKACTSSSCHIDCCTNTARNTDTGACLANTVAATNRCMNGGTMSGLKTYCICPEGFTGNICQHRTCSMKCQNGGACHTRIDGTTSLADTNYMNDHCVCPTDVTGKFCEIKKCAKDCVNNGTCRILIDWEMCDCKEPFYGGHCEKERKAGSCPSKFSGPADDCTGPNSIQYKDSRYRYECFQDDECPLDQKCCRSICGKRCAEPLHRPRTTGCLYKNETYPLGTAFTPDACRLCTCNVSHTGAAQAVVECTRQTCPATPVHCANVTTPAGECCPVCNDDPDLALCGGNYTPPTFLNCPVTLVVLDVGQFEDYANISIPLDAEDCDGVLLDIYMSRDIMFAGRGEDNYKLVEAISERDHNGNFADCTFDVRVRDLYPPEFLTCPTDFSHPHPGPVTWPTPRASDNVGLAITPTSRLHPGAFMDAGDHMVSYMAEDYEGNTATCTFVVSVGKGEGNAGHADAAISSGHKDHDDHEPQSHPHPYPYPYPHPHPHPSASHAGVSIGVGVVSSIVILVLVVIAFVLYFRQRRKKGSNQAAPPSGNNAANWNTNHAMTQPAHYSLPPDDVMMPPSYSQTDEALSGICSGGPSGEAGELPSKKAISEV